MEYTIKNSGLHKKQTERQSSNLESSTSGAPVFKGMMSNQITKEKKSKNVLVRLLDGIISGSLFLLFFGLPIFFLSTTFQGIAFEKQLFFYTFLLVGVVAWVAKGVITEKLEIRRTPLDIPLLLAWAILFLAMLTSFDKWHSFFGFFGDPSRGFLSITALVIAYYFVVSSFTKSRLKLILGAIGFSSVVVTFWSLLALLNVQFLPDALAQYAPVSLLGSFSALALFSGMIIPILIAIIYFLVKRDESRMKSRTVRLIVAWLLVATIVVNIFILALLYAFVSWIAVLVGISIFLIYILSKIVRPSESWVWVPMLVFVALLAVLMAKDLNLAQVPLPQRAVLDPGTSWEIVKNGIQENPILGTGLGTYAYDFSQFRPESYTESPLFGLRFTQGSGLLQELLPTVGLIGTIFVMLFILTYLSIGFYLLTREKESNKILSLGAWASSLVVLATAFLAPLSGPMLLYGSLIGILAIALLLHESKTEIRSLNLSLSASPKYALTLAFVFMVVSAGVAFLFVFIGKVYIADTLAASALRERVVSEEGSIQKLNRASQLYPQEGRYLIRMAQEYVVLSQQEALKAEDERDVDTLRRYLQNTIALSLVAGELMPNDIIAQEAIAQSYENASIYIPDHLSDADEAYQKALEIEPTNPSYQVKLGQIRLAQARNVESRDEKVSLVEESLEFFQKSVDIKEDFAVGYYYLALAHESLGNVDAAIENMENAIASLRQANLDYAFYLAQLHQSKNTEEGQDIAEAIYASILRVNEHDLNTRLSLGLLFEDQQRDQEAIDQYEKLITVLEGTNNEEVVDQLETMIGNVQNGIENTPENILGITATGEEQIPQDILNDESTVESSQEQVIQRDGDAVEENEDSETQEDTENAENQ